MTNVSRNGTGIVSFCFLCKYYVRMINAGVRFRDLFPAWPDYEHLFHIHELTVSFRQKLFMASFSRTTTRVLTMQVTVVGPWLHLLLLYSSDYYVRMQLHSLTVSLEYCDYRWECFLFESLERYKGGKLHQSLFKCPVYLLLAFFLKVRDGARIKTQYTITKQML